MRTTQVNFNTITLVVAGLIFAVTVFGLSQILKGIGERNSSYFLILWNLSVVFLLATGAIANFAAKRFAGWPTALISAGYFVSIWLVPMGIWGIVLLFAEHKSLQTNPPENTTSGSSATPPPLPQTDGKLSYHTQMRKGQLIFSAVSLLLATTFFVAALITSSQTLPGYPVQERGSVYLLLAYLSLLTPLIALGSLANIANGRLVFWPTAVTVLGLCLSGWFLPLGAWGVVLLIRDHKARRLANHPRETATPHHETGSA
jgi:hypothetical protein